MCYQHYSPSMFCPKNRKSIITQYLYWEELTEELREHGVIYYYGIDEFLKEYKKAVYSCLKNIEDCKKIHTGRGGLI